MKLAHLKERGLALYRAAKDKADREAERERVEREQAGDRRAGAPGGASTPAGRGRAAKRDPREELEEERRKARETMRLSGPAPRRT